MKIYFKIIIILLSISSFISFQNVNTINELEHLSPWVAPAWADTLHNPLKNNLIATAEGKSLFLSKCQICHGEKGKGDGAAGVILTPHPANFATESVQQQSDGAIFWKITTGRAPMATYKTSLSEKQRWALVNYIRELGKQYKTSN